MPLAEAVFGQLRWAGGQGDSAVFAVLGNPYRHGVGDGGWCADGPCASGEGKGEKDGENSISH